MNMQLTITPIRSCGAVLRFKAYKSSQAIVTGGHYHIQRGLQQSVIGHLATKQTRPLSGQTHLAWTFYV